MIDLPDVSEHWRESLDEYIARKIRTDDLRRELKAARDAGKAIRHRNRLRRIAGDTKQEGTK